MFFDTVCGIVERHVPDMVDTFRQTHVFDFVTGSKEHYKYYSDKIPDEDITDFYLPYKNTCIVAGKNVLILKDLVAGAVGCHHERVFIMAESPDDSLIKEFSRQENMTVPNDLVFILGGTVSMGVEQIISKGERRAEIQVNGKMGIKAVATKKRIDFDPEPDDPKGEKEFDAAMQKAFAMMKLLNHVNKPENFILETTPVKTNKKGKKSKKIPRTHDRPIYTILQPFKIREQMHLPQVGGTGEKGSKKKPYECRRHTRFLSDKKYRFDKVTGEELPLKVIPYGPRMGELYYKETPIPAYWVGLKENIVKGKRYRVILDR